MLLGDDKLQLRGILVISPGQRIKQGMVCLLAGYAKKDNGVGNK